MSSVKSCLDHCTGQLALPVGMAADRDGNVLVTDSGTGQFHFSLDWLFSDLMNIALFRHYCGRNICCSCLYQIHAQGSIRHFVLRWDKWELHVHETHSGTWSVPCRVYSCVWSRWRVERGDRPGAGGRRGRRIRRSPGRTGVQPVGRHPGRARLPLGRRQSNSNCAQAEIPRLKIAALAQRWIVAFSFRERRIYFTFGEEEQYLSIARDERVNDKDGLDPERSCHFSIILPATRFPHILKFLELTLGGNPGVSFPVLDNIFFWKVYCICIENWLNGFSGSVHFLVFGLRKLLECR